jgi:protein-tyrosine phosphatase
VNERTGVLFVCLGNICRSPLAEGIFIHMARERGVLDRFEIDSCGTGAWHVGEPADHRSLDVARTHGIELPSIARQVDPERDFAKFEWIIAMDRANVRSLVRSGARAERVRLMRSFDPAMIHRPEHEMDVPDPYDWPGDGFEEVYQMLHAACGGLLEYLAED